MVLAQMASVRLGAVTVAPALRRVVHDDGREVLLEPRVMQVLASLIRADGEILSRDDLVMSCWDGVVVGDDAINRVISRLRRLAREIGDGALDIETITKVGYRLAKRPPASVGAAGAVAAPARADEDRRPVLAVLAFDDLSEGAEMAWFSDGVSEEIQQTVARATDLRVIGRASSFQFRGADKRPAQVGQALGATHLLDGSVRRSGQRVRISAELIETAGQTMLWSDRFDRELSDVFELQDEIAAAVAAGLKAAFALAARRGRIDPGVYDLYLRARQSSPERYSFDLPMLREVVARAPQFARAWADLAWSCANEARWAPADVADARRGEALAAADAALRLDPDDASAHVALATLAPPAGSMLEIEARLARALASGAGDPVVVTFAGGFWAITGCSRKALAFAARAFELDPLLAVAAGWHAAMLGTVGDWTASNAAFDAALSRWPNDGFILSTALGKAIEARDWARADALGARGGDSGLYTSYVDTLLRSGRKLRRWTQADSDAVIAYGERQLRASGAVSLRPLGVLGVEGLADAAYDLIERADFGFLRRPGERMLGDDISLNLLFDQGWRTLRQDRRFVTLCARLGLCDYWVRSGNWPDCADDVGAFYDFRAEARASLC